MAQGLRGLAGFASLIFVAGALCLMLLITLAGTINHKPVNAWYLLQVDTSKISGAPAMTRWTYWNACGVQGGADGNVGSGNCHVHPAFPLNPTASNQLNTSKGVPQAFIGSHFYYYMTRFMFAFMLIALFFTAMALLTGVLALCSRLGSLLSSLLTMSAMFFQALNAALMTAAYVKGRNAFRANGNPAMIGKYAFAFEWAALACLFISTVLFCLGGVGRKDKNKPSKASKKHQTDSGAGGFSFGGRNHPSTRSRGSFIDGNVNGVNGVNGNKEYVTV